MNKSVIITYEQDEESDEDVTFGISMRIEKVGTWGAEEDEPIAEFIEMLAKYVECSTSGPLKVDVYNQDDFN